MATALPFILRYTGLFILLFTFAWWTQVRDWEPAITFLTTLLVFIGQDVYFHRRDQNHERNLERDKQLLEDLLLLLKPNNEIMFLKQHDHGASFLFSSVKNVFRFADTWNTSDREFLNPSLEKLRKSLVEAASIYVQKTAHYTYSDGKGSQELSDHLEMTNREEWDRQRQELNDLADAVVVIFDNLIRQARKKL
jgi:hypothetical protein